MIGDADEEKYLNILDFKTKNNKGRYEFDGHCKLAITNVQIKPHSCIASSTTISLPKNFLQELPRTVF